MPDPTPPPGFKVGTQTILVQGQSKTEQPRDVPVWIHEETGAIVPVGSPPGFIPPDGVPGDVPGTYVIPQSGLGSGRNAQPVQLPSLGPFPIPGWTPGMGTPPAGSIPGPTPGTYIIPGSPSTIGDYRGVGATPATSDQGPFPIPGFQPGPGGMPGQVPGQAPGQAPGQVPGQVPGQGSPDRKSVV